MGDIDAARLARVALRSLVVLAVLFVAALGLRPAEARDCRDETPLPADVKLIAPGPDIAPEAARFAGAWTGAWKEQTADIICATLVVEELLPSGHARVIYSHGAWAPLGTPAPAYWRATGRVVDGVLRFSLPVPDPPALAYTFTGAALSGTFRGEGNHVVTRAVDVSGIGCAAKVAGVTSPPNAASPRDRLTAAELLSGAPAGAGPVHNDYFMPLGAAAPARHALRGKLSFTAATTSVAHRGCRGIPLPTPTFSVEFFTQGDRLVPVERGIVRPPGTVIESPGRVIESPGRVIVSPGRVWSEPGDQGMSRASFPFVSVNELNNGTHNGLATFLFDDTRVSAVSFQFVQETEPWARNDYWGQSPLAYVPGAIADESALRARFDEELRRQVPMRPWSALPEAARPLLDGIDGEVGLDDVSASGLVVDGVLYVRGCNTRYGPYPYCREMRHGVFSVTKSLGAAIALLRLAQKYGDAVFDAKVADYVSITAAHDGWERVTFADALGMATGMGEGSPRRHPNDPLADENKPRMLAWVGKRTAKDKLDAGFAYPKYPWGPGQVLRYNSVHTFVLAAAMDAYLKRQAGPGAHLWDMVAREVYEPIEIFHAPMLHTLETDGSRGIPLLAYGLYPTIDDIAKLTTLLQSGGRHDGQQLLSATKLADALYRTSPDGGLPLGWHYRAGEGRYNLSFWSIPYRTSAGCFFQVPFMAGYGGNLVVLLPNGVSVFRFADAGSSDVESMVLAGEAIRPLCTPSAPAAVTPPRPPMTASELRAEMVGRSFAAGAATLAVDRSGVVTVDTKADVDVGRWHITDDGLYCRRWNVGDRGRLRCYRVYRDGEAFELHAVDRWTVTKLQRQP